MNEKQKTIWERLKTPPTSSLKEIDGGRLKGMSSIDPQWRLWAMTEVFGPAGIGWYYTIDEHWTEEEGYKKEISSHVRISLYIKREDEWSKPIPGFGGSKLLAQERSGPYHSDEAFKMALTDALSVSMKALGMAADIYMNKFDGTKYNDFEDRLKEPEPMTAEQVETLRKWAAALQPATPQNTIFINQNLTKWNKETAQVWLKAFEKDYGEVKTW